MKTMTVGELKSHFSEVLKEVQAGDAVGICFGRKREKRAVIIPFEEQHNGPRPHLHSDEYLRQTSSSFQKTLDF